MKNKIRNENFVVIQGWMLNELELKGNDLMVYAIIYGFSQSDNKCYNGSLQYLADWCNSSVNGIQKNLKNLVGKGLINKKEIYIKKVKFCEYTTKFDTIQLSCMGIYNNVNGDIQQSCNNNIDNNINNNIDNNSEKQFDNDKKTSATKMNTYSEHYAKLIAKEQYYMQIALKYGIDMNMQQWEQVMQKFIALNAEKKASVFDFKKHFENWLKSDYGEKEKEKAIAAEKEKVRQNNKHQL